MENWIFSIFPNETFVDLGLYQFGWERCEPSHTFGPAARKHYLFHYVLSGTGSLDYIDAAGKSHICKIKSGQGFMLFPNQVTTYTADRELPWEYVWLEFDGLRVKEALEICGLGRSNPVYHARFADLREQMKDEMLYITRHREESPYHLIGHLYLFLDLLTRSSSDMNLSKTGKMQDFYLKESITFIEQNFQNDISIEDIAAFLGLNRSYFGKIFKKAVGKTPQEFLITYRMIKACDLLKLTRLSIQDISQAVGYTDQLHFSRAFKKQYGIPPREWRKQNQVQGGERKDI
ncbi:MAG: AraC family transcriptional regulator [Clostridiales bacterium]|nr:AraC family transcriptional regulator [Clostridiales bacterium]